MSLETAELIKKTALNADIVECVLRCNTAVEAKPGQYILLKVDDVWRPFSVAETRDSNILVLVVQLVEDTISAQFFEKLTEGSHLELQEPRGELRLPDKSDIVLVATGTGIVPLYTVAKHLLDDGYTHKILIIFGVQSEKRLFYEEKLRDLEKSFSNCKVIVTVSSPGHEWSGERGRVSEYILKNRTLLKNHDFFVCGRKETVASLIQLLEHEGVPASRVNFIE